MQPTLPGIETEPPAERDERDVAILLGAGFSKWAADIPIATELFDFAIEPFGNREQAKLDRVKAIKSQWDSENGGKHVEEFVAHSLNLSTRDKQVVTWYIARRLSEPYIWTETRRFRKHRRVLMIDEHRVMQRPGVLRARQFLLPKLRRARVVLTTNYDLLTEYALGTKNFNYGIEGESLLGRGPYPVYQWRSEVTLSGRVPLLKLHGSISWDRECRYTDGRRGLTGNALIVPPSREKLELFGLRDVWKSGAEALRAATRLLVFGFAFNPYDEAFKRFLSDHGGRLHSIALVDIQPPLVRARSIWPNAEISDFPPDEPGLEALDIWLNQTSGGDGSHPAVHLQI